MATGDGVIFRVQDAKGRGPFRPGLSCWWVEPRADHENLIPWFEQFGTIPRALPGIYYGCGCRTLEGLRRWFTMSEYATLLRLGFRCVGLRAARVFLESDIQVLFERSLPLRENLFGVVLYAPPRL